MIYVAGHKGMVGSAIVRTLINRGYSASRILTRSHKELDLTNQAAVMNFFEENTPSKVFIAAATVGGIHANQTYPANFIYNNLMMASNIIHAAHQVGVQRLLFLGSSCIYPKQASQPIDEDALLSGQLEPTNEPYAVAKIAGIKLCESFNRQYGRDYRSIMPCNLYGPGDNYHPQNSHVIPALIRKFHEAKAQRLPSVTIWGSGKPRREFLYVDDMAEASVFVMDLHAKTYDEYTSSQRSHINVGSGSDISIEDLAKSVSQTVGYEGQIVYDRSKPDGVMRKLMDNQRIRRLGWNPKIPLMAGLELAYKDFLVWHA